MPVVGPLLIAGGSIGSALIGANAAKSAADQQAQLGWAALRAQNAARAKLNPWINVGRGANYTLGSLYGIGKNGEQSNANIDYSPFYNSPDYQFALQQGNLGLQRYENANGMAMSGGALKDVAQFNQGLASQQYGNYFNRLMGLSQSGLNAAGMGVGAANAAAGTMGGIGQSLASGIVGSANAITGGINSGINNSLLYNALNRSAYSNPYSYGNPTSLNAGNYGGTSGGLGGIF